MDSDLVAVVDEAGNVLCIVSRKEIRQKRLLHKTSFILVFNSHGELFITRRSYNKDYEPGKWEIGQGGLTESGESYEQSAVRELNEELGISAPLKYLFDFAFEGPNVRYLSKVFGANSEGPFKLQASEIESGKFISIQLLEKDVLQNPSHYTEDAPLFIRKYLEFQHSHK